MNHPRFMARRSGWDCHPDWRAAPVSRTASLGVSRELEVGDEAQDIGRELTIEAMKLVRERGVSETHLAIAIARACIRGGVAGRFFNVVLVEDQVRDGRKRLGLLHSFVSAMHQALLANIGADRDRGYCMTVLLMPQVFEAKRWLLDQVPTCHAQTDEREGEQERHGIARCDPPIPDQEKDDGHMIDVNSITQVWKLKWDNAQSGHPDPNNGCRLKHDRRHGDKFIEDRDVTIKDAGRHK